MHRSPSSAGPLCATGSDPGHATTDTDIRFKSRFETSGEFHRDVPPPTPRSEATVCAVTGGNIAELAATAFVALLIVLLSVRTIGYRGEQCGGGESVSQPSLKDKAFSTFLGQNSPLELRLAFGKSLFRQCEQQFSSVKPPRIRPMPCEAPGCAR